VTQVSPEALVQSLVASGIPQELADAVVTEYLSVKRRFYLGDHRPTGVDGGRYCEAVTRVLEHILLGAYTPMGRTLPSLDDRRLNAFMNAAGHADGLRILIPKALYFVYGIRNKRDVAHLSDGINPNLQDATVVVGTLDWIMAELVREFHSTGASEAQALISDLVKREVPVVEEIDGQPVCSKDLKVGDKALVFLYRAGREAGLDLKELQRQMRHSDASNLRKAMLRLDQAGLVLLHPVSGRAHITSSGLAAVESRKLLQPSS